MPTPFLEKNNILLKPLLGGSKGGYTFPYDISPKLNVNERLGFELAYFEAAV